MKKLVIGIDVGGTNVKLGVTNSRGAIIARSSFATKAYIRNKNDLIDAIVSKVGELLRHLKITRKDVIGIGIGLPGSIEPNKGIVRYLPNIPGWENVPLKKMLQAKLSIPICIENDVHLFTLGEWKFGAGKGAKNMICLTLGTGVGGGLIVDNKLYCGEGFVAGEIGHIPLNEEGPACNCGGFGCFERYVGNQKLLENIKNIFGRELKIPDVEALAVQGDERAIKFFEEIATHVGNALTAVINILNPTLIVIGGGVANNFHLMSKTIVKVVNRRAMKVQAAMVKIVQAKYLDEAGILGARVLLEERGIK